MKKELHLEQAEKEVTSRAALREISVARRAIEVLAEMYLGDEKNIAKKKAVTGIIDALIKGNMKRCPGCEVTWPRTGEFFDKDKGRTDGYSGWCKRCKKKAIAKKKAR